MAGLTRSPRPAPGSSNPAFSRFSAAFRSLSCRAPQLSHRHLRSERVRPSFFAPHPEHSLDDGYHWSTLASSAPYHRHLYSSLVRKPEIPASAKARESLRLLIIPATFRSSITTRPADLAIAVVALWCRSFLTLTIRACSLRRLAYSRSRRLEWALLAVGLPGAGNGLVQISQAPEGGLEHHGILHHGPVGADRQILDAHVHTHSGAILDRRQRPSGLHREAGKPPACGAVDGHLVDGATEPQMLHHGHPSDLGQDDRPAQGYHCIRAVVGPESLLVLAPLEPGKPHPAAGDTLIPFPAVFPPAGGGLTQVDDGVLG